MSAANVEDPAGPRLGDPLCHMGMHIVVVPFGIRQEPLWVSIRRAGKGFRAGELGHPLARQRSRRAMKALMKGAIAETSGGWLAEVTPS